MKTLKFLVSFLYFAIFLSQLHLSVGHQHIEEENSTSFATIKLNCTVCDILANTQKHLHETLPPRLEFFASYCSKEINCPNPTLFISTYNLHLNQARAPPLS